MDEKFERENMKLTREQVLEKYKGTELIQCIEHLRGGVGTYSLDVDIYKSAGDLLRITAERKSGPAIKPGEFRADEIYLLTIETVEKVGDEWKTIETIYQDEVRYNKYDDGDTKVEIIK